MFTLQLPDLGPLTHLGVKSDGAGDGPAWHLDKVCIIPPAAATSHQALGPTGKPAALGRTVSRATSLSINMAAAASSGSGTAALLLPAADKLEHSQPNSGGANAGHGHSGQPVWFVARRWLDAVHGLEVVLEAQATDPAENLAAYQVEVYTSNIK